MGLQIAILLGGIALGVGGLVLWTKREKIIKSLKDFRASAQARLEEKKGAKLKIFITLLIGAVLLAVFMCWVNDFNLFVWLKEHPRTAMLGLVLLLSGIYLEWVKPGVYFRFVGRVWRPPLLKFLVLTITTLVLAAVGHFAYDIDYERFVGQDTTPISMVILVVAAMGWAEGMYQATMQTIRIKEFNSLEEEAREKVGVIARDAIVKRANECYTVVGDYIKKVVGTTRSRQPSQDIFRESLDDRLLEGPRMSQSMVVVIPVLGLVGTILGMKLGMVGMREASGDVAGFSDAATVFIGGIDTALNTTLIGSVLGGIYFYVQSRILMGGAVLLRSSIVDFVETTVVRT